MVQCFQRFSVIQWFLCDAAIGPSFPIWIASWFRLRRIGIYNTGVNAGIPLHPGIRYGKSPS